METKRLIMNNEENARVDIVAQGALLREPQVLQRRKHNTPEEKLAALQEYQKKYYEARKMNLREKQKEYYNAHKETLWEKQRVYYDTHKDDILAKKRTGRPVGRPRTVAV